MIAAEPDRSTMNTAQAHHQTQDRIAPETRIGQRMVPNARPPRGFRVDQRLGLLVHEDIVGSALHRNPYGGLFETRCELTPGGDLLLMFPDGLANTRRAGPNGHYGSQREKVNRMLALRSRDRGRTWSEPFVPFDQEFNQHGFVPLKPAGTSSLYCFGTQPAFDRFNFVENAAIGWRRSDDDGRTWSDVRFIDPINDRGFQAMSVMRMTETARGTGLIGAHAGSNWYTRADGSNSTVTRQYVLRSDDRGETWTVHPGARPGGWFVPEADRMDEGRPIAVGDEVYMQMRTCAGRLWQSRSRDDGRTWEDPNPSPLVHPDAPPMLFLLEDGRTLAAFHHNSHTGSHFNGSAMSDRGQLWVALSRDAGRTWSAPRFVLANALAPAPENNGNVWYDQQCSYVDVVAAGGELHLFMPHRWQRALHLRLSADLLERLPTAEELAS
jgi:hypothetical protein